MKIFFQNMLNEVLTVVKNGQLQKKAKWQGVGDGRYILKKEHVEVPGVNYKRSRISMGL